MKSKVIFLFVFLALFSFVISSFSFAANIDVLEIDGKQINTSEVEFSSRWFMVYTGSSGSWGLNQSYRIYVLDDSAVIDKEKDGTNMIITGTFKSYYCPYRGTSFIYSDTYTTITSVACTANVNYFRYSSFNILYNDGSVFYSKNYDTVAYPSIVNKEEITTGKFDKVVINSGEYNHYVQQNFYFLPYYFSDATVSNYESLLPRKEILLDGPSNQYFVGADNNGEYVYEIPLSATSIDLVEGNKYGFRLAILKKDETTRL